MQDRYFETMAEYRQREATLRRLIGDPPNVAVEVVQQDVVDDLPIGLPGEETQP
jgi:hypothetical protein